MNELCGVKSCMNEIDFGCVLELTLPNKSATVRVKTCAAHCAQLKNTQAVEDAYDNYLSERYGD